MENINLVNRIEQLKKDKNAVILAHYYQEPEIQEIADYVGDSLGLSQRASETNADIIVFAGVHFMAETAKIINPSKKVVLPDLAASCSLSESCPPEIFRQFKEKHPNHVVVTYVNCSADIKSMSDIVCTSSNAVAVIESIPSDKQILFAPDRNLGEYLKQKTGRDLLLWDGVCVVHEAFAVDKIKTLIKQYPNALFIAHPESNAEVLQLASFVGSTAGMIQKVKSDPATQFIIATEAGILHEMQKAVPNKTLIPAPIKEQNTCACSECVYMKMNTLEKVYLCLRDESPEVIIEDSVRSKAIVPIERMLALSN